MILSFPEFMKRYSEFKDYRSKNIVIKLYDDNNYTLVTMTKEHLPKKLYSSNGKMYLIPSYMITEESKINFINKFPTAEADNFVVEIDDISEELQNKMIGTKVGVSKNQYIDLDKYVISESQHWLGQKIIEFYKERHKNSICLTSNVDKTKKIFDTIVRSNANNPVNYKKVLELFKLTGVEDNSFKNFVLRREI